MVSPPPGGSRTPSERILEIAVENAESITHGEESGWIIVEVAPVVIDTFTTTTLEAESGSSSGE